MDRHPAKVLEPGDVRRLLKHVANQRHNCRNQVIILLSFKAGLRACEIAGLDWTMVLSGRGKIAHNILISACIAKRGAQRIIPMHAETKIALAQLHKMTGGPSCGPVIRSERGAAMTPRSVVNWFANIYQQLGYLGCSSHSGRRTFITRSARLLAKTGGSLRDVQELAGHRSLTTTERYIAGDRTAQHKLIQLV